MCDDIAERNKKTLYNDQGLSKYVSLDIFFVLSLIGFDTNTEKDGKWKEKRNGTETNKKYQLII